MARRWRWRMAITGPRMSGVMRNGEDASGGESRLESGPGKSLEKSSTEPERVVFHDSYLQQLSCTYVLCAIVHQVSHVLTN